MNKIKIYEFLNSNIHYFEKPKQQTLMNEPKLKKSKVKQLKNDLKNYGLNDSFLNNEIFNGVKFARLQFAIHNLKEEC